MATPTGAAYFPAETPVAMRDGEDEFDGFPNTELTSGSVLGELRRMVASTRIELLDRRPGPGVPAMLRLPVWIDSAAVGLINSAEAREAHEVTVRHITLPQMAALMLEFLADLPGYRQREFTYAQQVAAEAVDIHREEYSPTRESVFFADHTYAALIGMLEALVQPHTLDGNLPPASLYHRVTQWVRDPLLPQSVAARVAGAHAHYLRRYTQIMELAASTIRLLESVTQVEGAAVVIQPLGAHGLRDAHAAVARQVDVLARGPADELVRNWLDKRQDTLIRDIWYCERALMYRDIGLPGHDAGLTTWPNVGMGDCFYASLMAAIGADGLTPNANMGGNGNVGGLNGRIDSPWPDEHLRMRQRIAQWSVGPADAVDFPAHDQRFRVIFNMRRDRMAELDLLTWNRANQQRMGRPEQHVDMDYATLESMGYPMPILDEERENLDRFTWMTPEALQALYPNRDKQWAWAVQNGDFPRSWLRKRYGNVETFGEIKTGTDPNKPEDLVGLTWGTMLPSWGPMEGTEWNYITQLAPGTAGLMEGGGRQQGESKKAWKARLARSVYTRLLREPLMSFHRRMHEAMVKPQGYLEQTTWGVRHPAIQAVDPTNDGSGLLYVYWASLRDVEAAAHAYKRYIIVWYPINEPRWECAPREGTWKPAPSRRIRRFQWYAAFGNPAWRAVHLAWTQASYWLGKLEDGPALPLKHYAPILSVTGGAPPGAPAPYDMLPDLEIESEAGDPLELGARGVQSDVPPEPLPLPPLEPYDPANPPPPEHCPPRGGTRPLHVDDDDMEMDMDIYLAQAKRLSLLEPGRPPSSGGGNGMSASNPGPVGPGGYAPGLGPGGRAGAGGKRPAPPPSPGGSAKSRGKLAAGGGAPPGNFDLRAYREQTGPPPREGSSSTDYFSKARAAALERASGRVQTPTPALSRPDGPYNDFL